MIHDVTLRQRESIRLRASAPGVRGSSRTMDMQCATARCCRIGDICSDAAHASGWPPCVCATAFWMFCVSERPCARYQSTSFFEKQVEQKCFTRKLQC